MATDQAYWIWLQSALGCGARVSGLLSYYKTPENIYNALCGRELDALISPETHRRLSSVSPSESFSIQKQCRDNGWHIITPDSACYPEAFLALDAAPLVLYVHGDPLTLRRSFSIGFVGTRMASRYGSRIAEEFAYCVAAAGGVVVSGCALGIDTASHRGALAARGLTVGVLGTGLGEDYPKQNRDVREAIARHGALLTEYPPFTKGSRASFPIRNRLIAALSLGVVVVEADVKSGALITASYAADYGRDVFAVPGEITNSSFNGCHKLIHDGAKPVFSAADILEDYAFRFEIDMEKLRADMRERRATVSAVQTAGSAAERRQAPARPAYAAAAAAPKKKPLPDYIDETGVKLYEYLVRAGAAEADEAAAALGADAQHVLSALTMLELAGVVTKTDGKYAPC